MKIKYEVKVLSFQEVHELPDSWVMEDFKEILDRADFEDWEEIEDSELKEYALMALQEFEADEAAEIVLRYKLGDKLSKGQIENLAHEMMDEKIWEEYTDINLHHALYDCAVLLKWAFPNKFPETDAVKCVLQIATKTAEPLIFFNKTFLARLLANGMDDHALINRLFDEQVGGKPFPEAEGIIWRIETSSHSGYTTVTIHSSNYWLHSMDQVDEYTSEAIAD